VAAVLALLSAVTYGTADFIGGLTSRRLPPAAVVHRSSIVALVVNIAALFFVGGVFTARDIVIGTFGGAAGGIGVLLLYRGLAVASMSVVAPITAVLSGIVPVGAGLLSGERPSSIVWCGIVVGLVSVACIAREEEVGDEARGPTPIGVLVTAAGAGLGFGLFFVAFDATSDDAGLWPALAGKAATVVMFTGVALVARSARPARGEAWTRSSLALLAAAGVFEATANSLFLLATQRGQLTIVAVLGALYPAATIILAGIVLHERLTRLQLGGVGLAGTAIVLITAG
jgi:drug/metabolite transporter (DMT)-like permease